MTLRPGPVREPPAPVAVRPRGSHRAAPTGSPGAGAHRWPALDGIRAFAVLAVILYHAGITWIPGGLLGVDTFFVLSGFLITSLLLAEWRRTGRIDLRRFWLRRARRLLPALLLLIVGIAGYALWIAPASRHSLRWDALAALFYVANWRFALSHQDYFTHFAAPSPLLHLWSLGVEEQFYLLWPLVTVLVLLVARRRSGAVGRVGAVTVAAVLGALLSTALLVGLHAAGVGASRLYYGTDTRALALLVGAALAGWLGRPAADRPAADRPAPDRAGAVRWPRGAAPNGGAAVVPADPDGPPGPAQTVPLGSWSRRLLPPLGLLGAAATVAAWLTVGGQSRVLYDGGFLLVALAVAAVVLTVVELPGGLLARALALPPLVWIGRISYGLYLWHWPVFLTLTAERTGHAGAALLTLRLAVTLALATASYYLVEQPIRAGRVRLPRPRLTAPATAALIVAAVVAATVPGGAAATGGAPSLGQEKAQAESFAHLEAGLAARPRGVGRPKLTLLVGDSVAFTLGYAMTPPLLGHYHELLLNIAHLGCGIAPGTLVDAAGAAEAQQASCATWPAEWGAAVNVVHPEVAALLVGRWETYDRRVNGRITHVGEPDMDAALSTQLDKVVSVLGRSGTKVALVTSPCFAGQENLDGTRPDQDDPARVQRFNALLRAAAARHPGQVSVVDIYSGLCPGGKLAGSLDGTPVRTSDGVHFDAASGPAVAPLLLPPLRALAGP